MVGPSFGEEAGAERTVLGRDFFLLEMGLRGLGRFLKMASSLIQSFTTDIFFPKYI